jgi:DNA primase
VGCLLPLLPREKIDEIRERTNIVEIVKRHVELRRAGSASWMGLCPFHAEKTPSFHVHESRQFFHCFGCGEKGDVFSFVTKIEQRSFSEVLRDFAREAGLELPERKLSAAERQALADAESERERLLRATEVATTFFQEQLRGPAGAEARAYLASRGISEGVIELFRIGYAPGQAGQGGADSLGRHLAAKGVAPATAEQLGLLGVGERGRYDFFRERVMLPVLDRQKRPTGFSSRLLDPEAKERKYLNSPDSPLFHKKDLLYGQHAALDAIRRSRVAVVVEGNFDVLSLHQAGMAEAVAPMGTALSTEQVALLGRLADRVVVVFDGDEAGRRAARKAVRLFVEANVDGRIARLPAGSDPDDFVRREGAAAFQKLVDGGRPVVEQLIDDLARATEATIPDRMKALEEVAPVLAQVRDQTARELYVGRLASTFGLAQSQVWRVVRAAISSSRQRRDDGGRPSAGREIGEVAGGTGAVAPPRPVGREVPRDELEALVLLVSKPALARLPAARRVQELLTDPALRSLARSALAGLQEGAGGHFDTAAWLDTGPEDVREAVSSALMDGRFEGLRDDERTLRSLILRLERARLEAEINVTKAALDRARQSGDDAAVRAMSLREIELIRTKLGLSQALARP